jgi:hypothetical protein
MFPNEFPFTPRRQSPQRPCRPRQSEQSQPELISEPVPPDPESHPFLISVVWLPQFVMTPVSTTKPRSPSA